MRNDLPADDTDALKALDIHTNLITKGLLLNNDIAAGAAAALLPLFRLRTDSPIWLESWKSAKDVAVRTMKAYSRRFTRFVVAVEELESTPGTPCVSAEFLFATTKTGWTHSGTSAYC